MADNDQTLAAITTPIRDLRDEVWVRVYADAYAHVRRNKIPPHVAGTHAAVEADNAVAFMLCPAHRKPEGA